ncbi:MAG: hypothetical protein JWO15_3671 [Sphingomonadales bacterium]|nr:hypothetical protein [Sphingomonadales bacterium]
MRLKLKPTSRLFKFLTKVRYSTSDSLKAYSSRFQYKTMDEDYYMYGLSILGVLNTLIGLTVEVKE